MKEDGEEQKLKINMEYRYVIADTETVNLCIIIIAFIISLISFLSNVRDSIFTNESTFNITLEKMLVILLFFTVPVLILFLFDLFQILILKSKKQSKSSIIITQIVFDFYLAFLTLQLVLIDLTDSLDMSLLNKMYASPPFSFFVYFIIFFSIFINRNNYVFFARINNSVTKI